MRQLEKWQLMGFYSQKPKRLQGYKESMPSCKRHLKKFSFSYLLMIEWLNVELLNLEYSIIPSFEIQSFFSTLAY